VKDNEELKKVMLMLLKIGNYLNQGSKKGNQVSFNIDLLSNLKGSRALGTHQKSSMLDFLLNSILSKSPSTAEFALKLEPCKEVTQIDLTIIENYLKQFNKDSDLIKRTIEEKTSILAEDREKLMPLLLKEESGETTEEENTQMEKLQARIDYQELYISKFGAFSGEMQLKV
jgi:hypothetical protein